MPPRLKPFGPPASAAAAKRTIKAAVSAVAERLGNTVAICRKCYVHPAVIESYGTRRRFPRRRTPGLRADEAAVLAILRAL